MQQRLLGGLAGPHAHPRQQRVQEARDGHTFTLDLEPSDKLTELSVRAAGKRAHLVSKLFRQAGAGRTLPMSLARMGWLRPTPRPTPRLRR
ncbi:MAG: hypothetical protein SYR96_31170 [Actinomycetota bacterium]|nr:hypothetical protein [Actinomycetota bacterium]